MQNRELGRITNRVRELSSAVTRWLDAHSGFRLYSAALLLSMIAAYDSQIWRQGTYYDDWEGIFLYKQGFSALQIWNYFLGDRPFSSLVHILYNPIVGASSMGWHVLGLLLNWAALLLLVATLLRLWPGRIMEAGWIGLLVGLYPAIHRQFVVHTSMPHYTSMLLFTLSLWLMVRAMQGKSHRVLLLGTSVILAALQVLIIEYFAALELLRILILFEICRASSANWKDTARRALRAWIPYGLVFGGFLVYHFAILPAIQPAGSAPIHTPTILRQLIQHPAGTTLQYLQIVLQDVEYSVLYAWTLAWVPQDVDLQSHAVLASWAIGAVVAMGCALAMWSWQKKSGETAKSTPALLIVLFCLAALFLGGVPAWSIGAQAVNGTWADRFLLGQVLGAVPLAVVGIVWLLGSSRRFAQNLIFAILLGSSVSMQFRIGNSYAVLWDRTRSYFWQLKWRIPSLEPGAFLVTTATPVGSMDNYQVGQAVNTAFNPGYGKEQVQYWWFAGPEELWVPSLGKYHTAGKVNTSFRSLSFHSDMLHALPVIQDKAGGKCVQVLDTVYQDEPQLPPGEQQLFTIDHVNMILAEERPMPQDVFGSEPPHDWCYYYQRADLARQFGRWDQALQLWREAAAVAAQPHYGPEYLPFIEAFANTGQWDQALNLSIMADAKTDGMSAFLCGNWARIMQGTPASEARTRNWGLIKAAFGCEQPQDGPP